MDSQLVELKTALASLFQSGDFSDLTIVCGSKRYPVHRALLATRSTFFQGACRNGFREAETGMIDLTEDDPEAVEHMMHYFYHLDYLNQTRSRRPSRRLSRPASPPLRVSKRPVPKKLNFAAFEDPLLASIPQAAMPLTPPADETTFQVMDEATKAPASPVADEFSDDEVALDELEPEVGAQQLAHLVTHARVYAIAEKYGVGGLKLLARSKFAQQLELHLDSAEFPEACQEAYESTFHTDRGLRDVIIQAFRANPSLSMRPDVELAVRETPGLAFELYRMASGLPVAC